MSTSMERKDQDIVKALPGNQTCADCGRTNPSWCTVSFGILLCLECAGKHRGMGVHISFVRSLDMDSFTENQLKIMKIHGGNQRCNEYLLRQGVLKATASTNIREKYDNEYAERYKLMLKARVEGQPDPPDQKFQTAPLSSSQRQRSASRSGQQPRKRTYRSFENSTPPPSFLASIISAYKMTLWSYRPIVVNRVSNNLWTTRGLTIFVGLVATTFKSKSYIIRQISGGAMAVIGFVSCAYVPLSFAYAFRTQRLPAHNAAVEDYTERCKSMRAKRNKGYEVFLPPNVSIGDCVDKAFVFYPDMLVDHMAYAMILGQLSDSGILILLVNAEPSRCCIEISTVDHLKRLVYEITTLMNISVKEWVLGGHSLGGLAAASVFTKYPHSEFPNKVTRLVQWAIPEEASKLKRTTEDRSLTIRLKSALRINATQDGMVASFYSRIQDAPKNNNSPEDGFNFESGMIVGEKHSGFAHYAPQLFPMDFGRSGISLNEQQAKVVKLTADFILESNKI